MFLFQDGHVGLALNKYFPDCFEIPFIFIDQVTYFFTFPINDFEDVAHTIVALFGRFELKIQFHVSTSPVHINIHEITDTYICGYHFYTGLTGGQ